MKFLTLLVSLFFLGCQAPHLSKKDTDRKPAQDSVAASFFSSVEVVPEAFNTTDNEWGIPGIEILPRPSDVRPARNTREGDICYNYRELMRRNDPSFNPNNQNELLDAVYQNGRIVLHHTAMTEGVSWMMNSTLNVYSDVPYHFVIDRQGQVYQGRPLTQMGAHSGRIPNRPQDCSNNQYYMDQDPDYRSIGIALNGDLDSTPASSAQMQALRNLIQSLRQRFNIVQVQGHRHVRTNGGTDCPSHYLVNNHSDLFDQVVDANEQARMSRSNSPYLNGRPICYHCDPD
jgi:N-acetyl-anhydromuramyl-L-alanine amidase AmpD